MDRVGQLLSAAAAPLAAYGYLLTGSPSAGEQLVEEAVVRVFSRRRPPRTRAATESQVRAAMVARALRARPDAPLAQAATEPVARVLGELSPAERVAVVLRYRDHLQLPEIAGAMRTSEVNVERHLSRGLAAFTDALGPIDPIQDPVLVVSRRDS